MFTGLIEDVGRVERLVPGDRSTTLHLGTSLDCTTFVLGESLAVNGVCLTVVAIDAASVAVTAVAETLSLTALGRLGVGTPVNLERALRVGDRLGGHMVQGHVDGVGALTGKTPEGDSLRFSFRCPAAITRYLVLKGSVAVDGISLTVAGVSPAGFEVAIIPHTLDHTTLGKLSVGAPVNLETDLIGKYVERLVGPHREGAGGGLTPDKLGEWGYE